MFPPLPCSLSFYLRYYPAKDTLSTSGTKFGGMSRGCADFKDRCEILGSRGFDARGVLSTVVRFSRQPLKSAQNTLSLHHLTTTQFHPYPSNPRNSIVTLTTIFPTIPSWCKVLKVSFAGLQLNGSRLLFLDYLWACALLSFPL